jgi:asparagine synthase (glutamine-hydrolysing)
LEDSIKLRFRSDVPVGFNISGGLDSSILLSQVSKIFPNQNSIQSFTFYTGHPDYDELPWVEQMISQTGFSLEACLLKSEEVPTLFEQVVFHEDEPFGGLPTLAYSKIFAQARENGIKVLLDGQGMDEAWAGYDYYRSLSDATIQGVKANPFVNKVMKESLAKYVNKDNYPKPFESELQNKQFRDLFYSKIPRALRFNDRISMMHSTELREPFLDHRLVELAFAQSDEVKISGGSGKALLREWAIEWMGKTLSLAPKRPIQTPQREWLGHEVKDWVNNQLTVLMSSNDWVDGKMIKLFYKQYLEGNNTSSFHIWQWISLAQMIKNINGV